MTDSRIDEEIKIYEDNSVLEDYDEEDEELFNDEINYWELDLDYYTKEKYRTYVLHHITIFWIIWGEINYERLCIRLY